MNGDTGELNLNSGAESTIEALLALQTIKESNQASKYLYAKPSIDTRKRFIKQKIYVNNGLKYPNFNENKFPIISEY
ncbi:hypothetical protein [Alkalihalobacillus sp. TS-13]|uniref:hypothetical protein n=1 Tax=Alkalihalobacillus sp. TS-13 TaxID=2842455 RepID=UPI001C877402|nr:hypothetical protein [Alkalihalobacillus sp. TS-13]